MNVVVPYTIRLRIGFLDFAVDFSISRWISGFHGGFLDFTVDFWISRWISGFHVGFPDFTLDFRISQWISVIAYEISGVADPSVETLGKVT